VWENVTLTYSCDNYWELESAINITTPDYAYDRGGDIDEDESREEARLRAAKKKKPGL